MHHQNMLHNVVWMCTLGKNERNDKLSFKKFMLLLFTRPLRGFLSKMQQQQAPCDTTYLPTNDNSYYISAAASHLNTQSHHTQRGEHGWDMNYSKSRELLLTWCTVVGRACAAMYVEAALSSYHQMLGMETKGCWDRRRCTVLLRRQIACQAEQGLLTSTL